MKLLSYIYKHIKKKSNKEKDIISALREIGVKIGNNCDIHKSVRFGTEPYLIEIGDNVRIAADSLFVTHDGGLWTLRNYFNMPKIDKFGKIKIGNNVSIGIHVTVMPGVTIGNNVVVGYGSVVTKDIPDNQVWAGVPAKFIETLDEYFNKNKDKFVETKLMSNENKKKYILDNMDKF